VSRASVRGPDCRPTRVTFAAIVPVNVVRVARGGRFVETHRSGLRLRAITADGVADCRIRMRLSHKAVGPRKRGFGSVAMVC
jgi:hypothetical protein